MKSIDTLPTWAGYQIKGKYRNDCNLKTVRQND